MPDYTIQTSRTPEVGLIANFLPSSGTAIGLLPQAASTPARMWADQAAPTPTPRIHAPLIDSAYPAPSERTKQAFKAARDAWKQRPQVLSVQRACASEEYLKIIGLGREAVQLILADLKSENDHWYVALHAITGESPVHEQDLGITSKMRDAWLNWGRGKGLV